MNQSTLCKYRSVLYTLGFLTLSAGTALHAGILYSQPFDGTGFAYASQNDTNSPGQGNFATTYDNFVLTSDDSITGVQFTGEYFDGSQAPITNWTLMFYNDNGGVPGAAIAFGDFPGTGNETFLGTYGGFATYTYELDFNAYDPGGPGTYWLSVVPDLGFPPQWGWSTGTGGDGMSYQDFLGTGSTNASDLAFNILGNVNSPEPVSMTLVGAGLGLLALRTRRRKTAA